MSRCILKMMKYVPVFCVLCIMDSVDLTVIKNPNYLKGSCERSIFLFVYILSSPSEMQSCIFAVFKLLVMTCSCSFICLLISVVCAQTNLLLLTNPPPRFVYFSKSHSSLCFMSLSLTAVLLK